MSFVEYIKNSLHLMTIGDIYGFLNGVGEFNEFITFSVNNLDEMYSYMNQKWINLIRSGYLSDDEKRKTLVVSDDSITNYATLHVLNKHFKNMKDVMNVYKNAKQLDNLISDLVKELNVAISKYEDDAINRYFGDRTMKSLHMYHKNKLYWRDMAYDKYAGGNGGCMRMIGVGYYLMQVENVETLIHYAIALVSITHHSATAILGGLCLLFMMWCNAAHIMIDKWAHLWLQLLESDIIDDIYNTYFPKSFKHFVIDKEKYTDKWRKYIELKFTSKQTYINNVKHKLPFERIKFYYENFSHHDDNPSVGKSGDDCMIIVYDLLTDAYTSTSMTEEFFIYYCTQIAGDSDTIGAISGALWGLMTGNSPTYRIYTTINDIPEIDHIRVINSNIENFYRDFQETKHDFSFTKSSQSTSVIHDIINNEINDQTSDETSEISYKLTKHKKSTTTRTKTFKRR